MKKIQSILGVLIFFIGIFLTSATNTHAEKFLDKIFGGSNDNGTIEIIGSKQIGEKSLQVSTNADNVPDAITDIGFRALSIIKYIVYAVLILMIIYTGFQMMHSMGRNEEDLTKAKNQLWYFILAMLFINVPGVLLNTVYRKGEGTLGSTVEGGESYTTGDPNNLIFNFGSGLAENIIWFLQVAIFSVAFFMFVYAGILLVGSRGKEDRAKEAKNKIIYTILALVFAGIIEAWKRVAYSGNVEEGTSLFETLANLALFFAAPVTLFFLGLAAYFMITANGDEEKVKKAKIIVLSTVLGVFILLGSYVLLIELSGGFGNFTPTTSTLNPTP